MSIRHRSSFAVVLLTVFAAGATFASSARADDDALAQYRDRFRLGMEKYKAGSMAEAIRVWNGIYEEIGPTRGYRLSYNLARAYDVNGEATRAAERYRSFLEETSRRQSMGEALDPLVEREAHESDERLESLNREHGRIEIAAGAAATLAQVDDADPRLGAFTAYVAAGKHVVTFGPGRASARKVEVTVENGERVETRDPAPPQEREALPPTIDPLFPVLVAKHPFSPVVLYVGAAASVVSIVAPALEYAHVNSLYATATSGSISAAARTDARNGYGDARTVAYALVAVPITLGAVTAGLTAWYVFGTKEQPVKVSLQPSPLLGGGALSAIGTF